MIDDYCEVHMTHHPTHPTVLAVSGNPRPGSRTLGAAETVARRVAGLLGTGDVATVDQASVAAEVRTADPPAARAARAPRARAPGAGGGPPG
ncbi:MAG: hypothetical protein ACTMIE_11635, partial [Cellulosimicrobium funkei]